MSGVRVDVREAALIAALRELLVDVEVCPLDVGDVECRDADNMPVAVIERKTLPDLVASVKDGRWAEQRCRLHAAGCRVVYTIEGGIPDDDDAVAWGCVINSMIRDGVPVFIGRDVNDTARLVREVSRRAGNLKAQATPHQDALCTQHTRGLKRGSAIAELGPRHVLLCALSAIPMVSAKMAGKLADALGADSISEFSRQLVGGRDAAVALLRAVPGVGPKLAARIVDAWS